MNCIEVVGEGFMASKVHEYLASYNGPMLSGKIKIIACMKHGIGNSVNTEYIEKLCSIKGERSIVLSTLSREIKVDSSFLYMPILAKGDEVDIFKKKSYAYWNDKELMIFTKKIFKLEEIKKKRFNSLVFAKNLINLQTYMFHACNSYLLSSILIEKGFSEDVLEIVGSDSRFIGADCDLSLFPGGFCLNNSLIDLDGLNGAAAQFIAIAKKHVLERVSQEIVGRAERLNHDGIVLIGGGFKAGSEDNYYSSRSSLSEYISKYYKCYLVSTKSNLSDYKNYENHLFVLTDGILFNPDEIQNNIPKSSSLLFYPFA